MSAHTHTVVGSLMPPVPSLPGPALMMQTALDEIEGSWKQNHIGSSMLSAHISGKGVTVYHWLYAQFLEGRTRAKNRVATVSRQDRSTCTVVGIISV